MLKIKTLSLSFLITLFFSFSSNAADGGHFGLSAGTGIPYIGQAGLHYVSASNTFSVDLGYNMFTLTSGEVSVELAKPEVKVKWHPMHGSFYVGVGLGQSSLVVEGVDSLTSQKATVEVTSMTLTPSLGWMWGATNGGLFIGMDIGYQMPLDAETTITTTLPVTDQAYIDAVDAGDEYGEASYPIFTLLRIGYLF